MTIDENGIKHSTNKPTTPSTNLKDLLEQSYCCVWTYQLKDGRYEKRPRSIKEEREGKWFRYKGEYWKRSVKNGEMGSFDRAFEVWTQSQSWSDAEKMQGISIFLEPETKKDIRGNGIPVYPVVVDLDECADRATGEVKEWAQTIVIDANTYTEFSPSDGLRLFGYTTEPINVSHKFYTPDGRHFVTPKELDGKGEKEQAKYHRVEVYGGGYGERRMMTLTGHALDGMFLGFDVPLNDLTEWVKGVPRREVSKGKKHTPVTPTPIVSTDEEINRIIDRSKNKDLFDRFRNGDTTLWEGEDSLYPSNSEADSALIYYLVFYCQGNRDQVKRLARSTGMNRARWDDNYLESSINKAIAWCNKTTGFYDPRKRRENRQRSVEWLFHQRMNHKWDSANERDLYLAFLILGYWVGECTEEDRREGFVVDASTRDLNLLCSITNPSGKHSKDLTEVSKTWPKLERKGKIKKLDKGGRRKSSTYFVPFDFGLIEEPSTHENPHTDIHSCVFGAFSSYKILNNLGNGDLKEQNGEDNSRVPLERIPREDEIDGRPLPFYLKIMWLPDINKHQRFLIEEILYGRTTLEDLYTFFQPKRRDIFKKNRIGKLLSLGLIVEDKTDGEIHYEVSIEGIERKFEEGGRDDLAGYMDSVSRDRAKYRQSGDKFNHLKSIRKMIAYYKGQIHFRELSTWEQFKTWDYVAAARQDNTTPLAILEREMARLVGDSTGQKGEK